MDIPQARESTKNPNERIEYQLLTCSAPICDQFLVPIRCTVQIALDVFAKVPSNSYNLPTIRP